MFSIFGRQVFKKQSFFKSFVSSFFLINFGFCLSYQHCGAAALSDTASPSNSIEAEAARIDGQQSLLQQERERSLREKQEHLPDVLLTQPTSDKEERLPIEESPCLLVKHINFVGDSASLFEWARPAADKTKSGQADMATSRCLGADGINLVMKRIQNAIVARGFVTTRVLAAPQDIAATGILQLTILPGRIRHIRFADKTVAHAPKWNAFAMRTGDILNLRDIEQALENFQRVPTAEADIKIIPAEGAKAQPGQSDLVIAWKQRFPIRVGLSLDDSGSASTGKYQSGLTVSVDNLLTSNDLFYFTLTDDLGGGHAGDRGTRGHIFHYSVPYAYWLLSFTSSKNKYNQTVDGPYEQFLYAGESENSEIKLARLVYRNARRKTTVSLRGWHRNSKNFISDAEVWVQRRRMAGWDVALSHREFINQATLDTNFTYRRGTGALDSLRAPEELLGTGTARPKIMIADAQLTAPFQLGLQRFRYSALWRAQWNRTPLIMQDRFALGGRYTVRGFDGECQLLGDRGWLMRNDLSWTIGKTQHALYLGFDYGEVGGLSSPVFIGTSLSGIVLGARGQAKWLNYELFIGRPLNSPKQMPTAHYVTGFNFNISL